MLLKSVDCGTMSLSRSLHGPSASSSSVLENRFNGFQVRKIEHVLASSTFNDLCSMRIVSWASDRCLNFGLNRIGCRSFRFLGSCLIFLKLFFKLGSKAFDCDQETLHSLLTNHLGSAGSQHRLRSHIDEPERPPSLRRSWYRWRGASDVQ